MNVLVAWQTNTMIKALWYKFFYISLSKYLSWSAYSQRNEENMHCLSILVNHNNNDLVKCQIKQLQCDPLTLYKKGQIECLYVCVRACATKLNEMVNILLA